MLQLQRINIDDDTDSDSTSYLEKKDNEFDILKISKQPSFKIDSSYDNLNEIYGGKLTIDQQYKEELKNLIVENLKKTKINSSIDPCMQFFKNPTLTNNKLNLNSGDNLKKKPVKFQKSLVTFAMQSSDSLMKYGDISNKSNNILKGINNKNEDNNNKNQKNVLNNKMNYTNSSLVNKSVNSIDKLNNEKIGNECKSINIYYPDVLQKKNEKNIQSSNELDSIISSIPINYGQFNLYSQREMECEINNKNGTYNTKILNNLIRNTKYSDSSQKQAESNYSNNSSSIAQASNNKKGGLISQYRDNLDKLKIISRFNYNKFDDSSKNEFEFYKNNKSKCYIF